MRNCGVLLPISSIPSKYGIGAFSKEAYEFVDFLEAAGQTRWQILPLGPTSYGDSPYQSFSTFAGNPYFIDLETLTEEGLLTEEECNSYDFGADDRYVDYEKIYLSRFKILKKAFKNADLSNDEAYQQFVKENEYWLEGYALFMAIKDAKGGVSFMEWEDDIRTRKPEAVQAYAEKYAEEVEFYKFLQYEFKKQWNQLKAYANKKNVKIVGDIPIYVSGDSSDVWVNPELFQLDEEGKPVAVAGCPPDAFSATGQLWGNPLYRWDYHAKTGYEWWMQRISHCFELYDILRIDHFRGFDEYYSIPYGDPTAEFGHWEKGPGYDLFKTMKSRLGKKEVIAEDLGFLTPSVIALVKKTGFPGMKVLQFAFDSREESDYLPHNYDKNCVVYTGTHDNATTTGWVDELNRKDKALAKKYLNVRRDKDICPSLVRTAYASVADLAVIPIQDFLELDNSARINIPSTLGGNWEWRLLPGELTDELAASMMELAKTYGRFRKKVVK